MKAGSLVGASCARSFLAQAQVITTGTLLAFLRPEMPAKLSHRTLTFAERVAYQRAIEDVYSRHRIWPKENAKPKPSLDEVMSQAQLEKKVTDYLRNSHALENYWQQPLTAAQLQSEMERMAQHTKQPEILRELFEALGNERRARSSRLINRKSEIWVEALWLGAPHSAPRDEGVASTCLGDFVFR
jgi:hypothetical protein